MGIEAAMNFSLGAKEEAIEAAKQAEFAGGNYVKEPGAYEGIVETAVFKKFTSGAGGVEIAIKTDEGLTCKVMIITMKKDGTSTYKNSKGELMPLPGINQMRGALMPCLRQKDLVARESGEDIIYPTVIGQRLGMLVNIRKTLGKGKDGRPDPNKVYENADLKTFYCPKTGLCGSEILNKIEKPERKAKIMESLQVFDETAVAGATTSNPADPFGDATASGASVDDPFATGDSMDTGAVDTTPEKTGPTDAEIAAANQAAELAAKQAAEAAAKQVAEAAAKEAADKVAKEALETSTPGAESSEPVDDFWK